MMSQATQRGQALKLLRRALNDPRVDFREGQWEAIEALVNRRARLLVVERTGWGKSSGCLMQFLGEPLDDPNPRPGGRCARCKVLDNEPQKHQETRYHRCRNLDGVFAVEPDIPADPVLLVDDVVDSAWTLTVVAALLREAGSGPVWPIALATSSVGD